MSDKPDLEFFPENDFIVENPVENLVINVDGFEGPLDTVSYTHLTLPTIE